jgi:beta-glucanase (GH16 family)
MSDHAADQQQVFRENNNHIMTGCTMKLTAYAEPDDAGGTQYPSGMLRSKTTFMYGYFEARVKVPGGKGVHPAFWMNSSSFPTRLPENPPEIDTQEFVNNAGTNTVNMMHMDVIDDGPQTHTLLFNDPSYDPVWGNYTANYNFPDDFHIFALLWDTDDTASLYLDGQLIVKRTSKWLYDDGTPAPFANVMVDFEIGGAWPGANGIDNGAFPQAYEIDYVRVYQKPNSVEQTGVDTVGHDLCPPNGGC